MGDIIKFDGRSKKPSRAQEPTQEAKTGGVVLPDDISRRLKAVVNRQYSKSAYGTAVELVKGYSVSEAIAIIINNESEWNRKPAYFAALYNKVLLSDGGEKTTLMRDLMLELQKNPSVYKKLVEAELLESDLGDESTTGVPKKRLKVVK